MVSKSRRRIALLVLALALAGSGCRSVDRSGCEPIRRDDVIVIAESYAQHRWTPTQRNILHGPDPDGIRVETPDADYLASRKSEGGWRPGEVNVGVAYQWGGFATLEQFDAGIRAGKYAGDVHYEKGQVASAHAVGVDCSGFVSRCWRLGQQYSTRTLPSVCVPLSDARRLERGDILNKCDGHVVLFHEFIDASKSRLRCYEATRGKVRATQRVLDEMLRDGYQALRYRNIRD